MACTIVICSTEDDVHAARVAELLKARHGKSAFIFDTSTFPGAVSLAARFDGRGIESYLRTSERRIDLDDVAAFWWRRPQPMGVDARIADAQARDFAFQECISGLLGILECCDALWVNVIQNDVAAEYKPFQLKVARNHGFRIPETLITNLPDELMDFWHRHQRSVVYKAFNQRAVAWRPTRLLREEDLALLGNLRHAPVIFQPLVTGTLDIRVTVVGDAIFASQFDIERMDEIDHRMRLDDISCRPHRLPSDVEEKVRAFMSELGLEYGGVDFRVTPDGEYVFFEVNTAGEFMYLESRTGQPIAEAMAAHLAGGAPARPARTMAAAVT